MCQVNKCLLSVARLNAAGQRVTLDGKESYIEDKRTGERTQIQYTNGVYHLGVWVKVSGKGVEMSVNQPAETQKTGCQRQV